METLDLTQPLDLTKPQKVSYCIPLVLRDEQIRLATKRVQGRIQPYHEDPTVTRPASDRIAVVGYGPSLTATWEQVRDFRWIITCSGAHRFLIDRGIVPQFHCEVDPRPHKADLIGEPHPDVEYLIASTCHPRVFDRLDGFNVKLWHIFAEDGESFRVLPRGEWAITGGCDAGMRAMTLARFLGFVSLDVFGMDGCEGATGKHAAAHPKQVPVSLPVVYNGVTYRSTPALVECARQTFKELDQMPDVTATFHGDGLIQAMARDYVRQPATMPVLGFQKPTLISAELRDLNARLHVENPAYGVGGATHAPVVLKLLENQRLKSVLDYGSGKGQLAKALPVPIWEYDPAIPGKDEPPRPADLVVCTDCLEHIEPDKLVFVLDDLRRVVQQIGYFVISTSPAQKTYADGRNTHLIQEGATWWRHRLDLFFHVAQVVEKKGKLHVIVAPKPKKQAAA
jgi:hypothetical protein